MIRDLRLLDAVEACPTVDIDESVWRLSRETHNPVGSGRSKGRWDDGTFDVLYTSLNKHGAIAEVRYHLESGQPVFPRSLVYRLVEIPISLTGVLDLSSFDTLRELGVEQKLYGRVSYGDLQETEYLLTQQIGEIAHFLEFPGIVVPNARYAASNVLIISDNASPSIFEDMVDHGCREIKDWIIE